MFQLDIPLFTLTWPDKHSPNQGCESTHRLHLCPLGDVLSYVHTSAGRLRSGGGWILTFPLRYRGYVHTYAGGSAISWGQWWFGARGFEADAANWVLDPFLAERILLPLRLRFATGHVWTHVMICVEAIFPPTSARACVNVPSNSP